MESEPRLMPADDNYNSVKKTINEKSEVGNDTKKTAELSQIQAGKDAAAAAKILEQIKGKDPIERRSIKKDSTYQNLVAAFQEHNFPGAYDAKATEKWRVCSREMTEKLDNIGDIKEAYFYLTNEDKKIIEKKWDKLSWEEVEAAASEEDMGKAIGNIRTGGFAEPIKIRERAIEKFPSLSNLIRKY